LHFRSGGGVHFLLSGNRPSKLSDGVRTAPTPAEAGAKTAATEKEATPDAGAKPSDRINPAKGELTIRKTKS